MNRRPSLSRIAAHTPRGIAPIVTHDIRPAAFEASNKSCGRHRDVWSSHNAGNRAQFAPHFCWRGVRLDFHCTNQSEQTTSAVRPSVAFGTQVEAADAACLFREWKKKGTRQSRHACWQIRICTPCSLMLAGQRIGRSGGPVRLRWNLVYADAYVEML